MLHASAGGSVWAVLRCNSRSVHNVHAAPGRQGLRGAVPFLVNLLSQINLFQCMIHVDDSI